MNGKDTDDVNEGMNEFDDNSYGPCFTVNSGQYYTNRYCLNRHDEPITMAGPKTILTEFGIHHRLESCG